jgi:hypothetical protein
VERQIGGRLLEGLKVCVDGEELDSVDLRLDHPVDGVDAGSADPDDADDGMPGLARSGRGLLTEMVDGRLAGGAVHHVLGDLGGEDVAQALLRRGDLNLGLGLERRGAQGGMRQLARRGRLG